MNPEKSLALDNYGPDRSLTIPCSCGCSIVTIAEWIDFEDEAPSDWFLEFFASPAPTRWRSRLQGAWNLLRGKPAATHCVCWRPEQVAQLRDWLNEWTDSPNPSSITQSERT